MQIKKYNKNNKEKVENVFKLYWNDPEFLSELSENLESDNCKFYTALDGDNLCGVIGIRRVGNFLKKYISTNKAIELYIIASKAKNKGVGTVLFKNILNKCKKYGYTEIICYSPETHNDSWRFYEKNGFTSLGIVTDPDDGCPGMLWKILL